jgi:hypothetical protein
MKPLVQLRIGQQQLRVIHVENLVGGDIYLETLVLQIFDLEKQSKVSFQKLIGKARFLPPRILEANLVQIVLNLPENTSY